MAADKHPTEILTHAIVAGIQARLEDCPRIEAYPEIGDTLPEPLIAIELASLEPDTDSTRDGAADFILHFCARVVLDPLRPGAQYQAPAIASQIALAVAGQTWGLSVQPAQLVGDIGQDGMDPRLDAYLVWTVEWTHLVWLDGKPWT